MTTDQTAAARTAGEGIAAIERLLACPECRDPLSVGPDWIRCEGCDARYPIEDGIALLAVRGGSETWGAPQESEQGTAYQEEFQDVGRAAAYNLQFRRMPLKLGVTPRESQLIRRCIHPDDDLEARNLHDTERRWYYTVFLQALGSYLHEKLDRQ